MLQVAIPPEIIIILLVIGGLAVLGLLGMILFRSFLKGYNDGAGYSEE